MCVNSFQVYLLQSIQFSNAVPSWKALTESPSKSNPNFFCISSHSRYAIHQVVLLDSFTYCVSRTVFTVLFNPTVRWNLWHMGEQYMSALNRRSCLCKATISVVSNAEVKDNSAVSWWFFRSRYYTKAAGNKIPNQNEMGMWGIQNHFPTGHSKPPVSLQLHSCPAFNKSMK